jgi:hypothetical protein
LTPTRHRSPSPPPRTGSHSPSGSSDKQSDESELSAEERSVEEEQEQELDVRESAQRILGEQRLIATKGDTPSACTACMEEYDHQVSQTTGGCEGERTKPSRAVENELADRYL